MLRAYLVDDEPLAVDRLTRMLKATNKVEVCGSSTDPMVAREEIERLRPQVLFLDIHMPGLTGFALLAEIRERPSVIFTTAYDQHALEAFRVSAVDYLLKPIEPDSLEQAIAKAERAAAQPEALPDIRALLQQLSAAVPAGRLRRIPSRSGEKVELIELRNITHFFAKDKLTFASAAGRNHVVDFTIEQLEQKLDPALFLRIHRGTILNLDHLHELHPGVGGGMIVRLKDAGKTELSVSRERVRTLRERIGL